MKILVFSDSHGRTDLMESITQRHSQEIFAVCFLGDVLRDCAKLQAAFPNLDIYAVPGNCDPGSRLEPVQIVELGGAKILLTHGHLHGVKRGYGMITAYAAEIGVDACFFGHSHVPIVFENNGITFLNPGSITQPRGSMGKSYALVEIAEGKVLPTLLDALG
ncbi:MAG: metallophosphoesterase [Defluviitaleaceae bacterium]|nr:metallophosphoesterase [Defluviitaleaceae bacterium]